MGSSVRVRFAPSPTGHLHIGSARTALFNWLLARHEGGMFMLRIEDTDRERSKDAFLETVLADLRWLGLDWDEGPDKGGGVGPYFQSQRLDIYKKYADQLLTEGKAYHCYCTPDELARKRDAALAEKKTPGYDGACRELTAARKSALEAEGRTPVIRFRVPERGMVTVDDAIRGVVEFSPELLEDFVIVKSDGFPPYNFACVVDDHLMGITHVMRGEEHLSNTPRQVLLYRAFGWAPPVFGHLSIILDEHKKKLSKRTGSTYLGEFRDAGFLPEAILNFLTLLGWAPGDDLEIMPLEEIVRRFGFAGIGKSPAVFDFKKLEWMNGQYIMKLDKSALAERLIPFLKEAGYVSDPVDSKKIEWIGELTVLFRERIKTLREFVTESAYFFIDDYPVDGDAAAQILTPPAVDLTRELIERLEPLQFTHDALESAVRAFAEEKGVKAAAAIHPLRLLLTGRKSSPGIFEVIALLGKEKTLARLKKGVAGGSPLKSPI